MYKIIALIGEAGSGKDTMMKMALDIDSNLYEIVSCTTRPPREGEINFVNYIFLTDEQFQYKVNNNEMFEHTCFNSWHYGTSIDSISKNEVNIGVFNPAGVRSLLAHPEVEVVVYYIAAFPKTRLLRQLNREYSPNVDEIIRRYSADKEDFNNVGFKYLTLYNENAFDLAAGAKEIVAMAGRMRLEGQNELND